MPTEKHNYFQLIKANQWASRVFIDGEPITITIQDILLRMVMNLLHLLIKIMFTERLSQI